jgi:glycerophosphoryl diester phosphodiesterase
MTAAGDPDPRARFGEAWDLLFGPPVAHRGLWAPDGAPENSLSAFQAACAHGYGVELDVQLSADGEALVFHDARLERMTGAAGRIGDHRAADLVKLRLGGADEPLPTLAETLTVIGHRAMVLIELKTAAGDVGALERRVHEVLIDHNGPAAVIGFNPYSHAWFAHHHPKILRGLNSYAYNDEAARTLAPPQRAAFAKLEQVSIARPHFLALSRDVAASPRAAALRRNGMPVIAWTVRAADQWDALKPHCDTLNFEGFAA